MKSLASQVLLVLLAPALIAQGGEQPTPRQPADAAHQKRPAEAPLAVVTRLVDMEIAASMARVVDGTRVQTIVGYVVNSEERFKKLAVLNPQEREQASIDQVANLKWLIGASQNDDVLQLLLVWLASAPFPGFIQENHAWEELMNRPYMWGCRNLWQRLAMEPTLLAKLFRRAEQDPLWLLVASRRLQNDGVLVGPGHDWDWLVSFLTLYLRAGGTNRLLTQVVLSWAPQFFSEETITLLRRDPNAAAVLTTLTRICLALDPGQADVKALAESHGFAPESFTDDLWLHLLEIPALVPEVRARAATSAESIQQATLERLAVADLCLAVLLAGAGERSTCRAALLDRAKQQLRDVPEDPASGSGQWLARSRSLLASLAGGEPADGKRLDEWFAYYRQQATQVRTGLAETTPRDKNYFGTTYFGSRLSITMLSKQ
ncbi:MAG: hypothetical protein JNL08_13070 [Planctomycetes bacterium]|nr:hypothetical protein [Planctomycetota bacterium]